MSLTTLTYIAADLIALAVLVGALYAPRHSRKDLMAAYIGVNVGVLAVTLLLSTSDNVGAGLGLGLFGVLSIIRLRSSSLAQGEVAYFFAALAWACSAASRPTSSSSPSSWPSSSPPCGSATTRRSCAATAIRRSPSTGPSATRASSSRAREPVGSPGAQR